MENKNELIKALIEAEKDFSKIELNKIGQVGNHKFKYADLTSVFNATKPALRKNGLKVIGVIEVTENGDNMLCMTLFHVSGQQLTSKIKLPSNVTKSTEVGSILTYMRRYLYSTLLGVAAEEDVEGDALDECDKIVNEPVVEFISESQLKMLLEFNVPSMKPHHNRIRNHYGIQQYAQLPAKEFDKVYSELKTIYTNIKLQENEGK